MCETENTRLMDKLVEKICRGKELLQNLKNGQTVTMEGVPPMYIMKCLMYYKCYHRICLERFRDLDENITNYQEQEMMYIDMADMAKRSYYEYDDNMDAIQKETIFYIIKECYYENQTDAEQDELQIQKMYDALYNKVYKKFICKCGARIIFKQS
jgi:hypothetical protein